MNLNKKKLLQFTTTEESASFYRHLDATDPIALEMLAFSKKNPDEKDIFPLIARELESRYPGKYTLYGLIMSMDSQGKMSAHQIKIGQFDYLGTCINFTINNYKFYAYCDKDGTINRIIFNFNPYDQSIDTSINGETPDAMVSEARNIVEKSKSFALHQYSRMISDMKKDFKAEMKRHNNLLGGK